MTQFQTHSKRNKAKAAKAAKVETKSGKVGELSPPPSFLAERIAMWERLKAQSDEFLASQVPEPIQVKLPDGKIVEAKSWRTTPYEVACGISKGLADNSVVAKVNGEVWDLDRPLEKSSDLQLLKFDDEDAQVGVIHA